MVLVCCLELSGLASVWVRLETTKSMLTPANAACDSASVNDEIANALNAVTSRLHRKRSGAGTVQKFFLILFLKDSVFLTHQDRMALQHEHSLPASTHYF